MVPCILILLPRCEGDRRTLVVNLQHTIHTVLPRFRLMIWVDQSDRGGGRPDGTP